MIEKNYLSLSSIAEDLDCSVRTVQYWAQTGKIETVKLFGRILVDRAYYVQWKQRHIVRKGAS